MSTDSLPIVIPFSGAENIRSLEDENYGPIGSYTDKGRIREALAAAVAMGATTVSLLRS